MKTLLNIGNKTFSADLEKPVSIGIRMESEVDQNPICFYALPPQIKPFVSGDFIGSIKEGSPVNFKNVFFNPHGNGTHTECSGHIYDNGLVMGGLLRKFFWTALLVSIRPEEMNKEQVVRKPDFLKEMMFEGVESVVIRTLPNDVGKIQRKYSGTNPPYIDSDFIVWLRERGIQHLLTDLPSVDKEEDGGALAGHKAFWESEGDMRTRCTISELIYVPESVKDGLYLLEFQIMNLALDAAPSNPILYNLKRVDELAG